MEVGGPGRDGRWATRPVATGAGAVGFGGGKIGGEPSHDGGGTGGIGVEQRLNPREVAQCRVDELPVKLPVAGPEGAIGGKFLLNSQGQGWVRVPVRAQHGEEAEEYFLLAAEKGHSGRLGVEEGKRWRRGARIARKRAPASEQGR